MGDIVDISEFHEHDSGMVKCLLCGHENVAVWPLTLERLLECKKCSKHAQVPIEAYCWVLLTLKEMP